MKLLIQKVKQASVSVGNKVVGNVDAGMLIYLGVVKGDAKEDVDYLVDKIISLRIFADSENKMNIAAKDCAAEFLVVSQFTLCGTCNKGNRPSFDAAANPKEAEELYEYFVSKLKSQNFTVTTGSFGAYMQVSSINDGPVTFILESKR